MMPRVEGVLFEGGVVHTLDPQCPSATAVAVQQDRIVMVGDGRDLRAACPRFARVALDGRTVLPAFTDSHIHLAAYGLALRRVDLRGAPSLRAAVDIVAGAARRTRPGEWIRGGRWDKNLWPEGRFPRKEDLDPVTGDHPAALASKDGHVTWANSNALRLAGIGSDTPDPQGGKIVRDSNTNEPTGLLAERAADLVTKLAGRPTPEALEAAIIDAAAVAHRAGLAGVHVMEDGSVLAACQRLRERGALGIRVYMMIPEDGLEAAIQVGIRTGLGDSMIRVGGVKIFSDGALGPQTASMLEPYEGDPGNTGVVVRGREQLIALIAQAARHGIAAVVHAIGDRANRCVLDAIEAVNAAGPPASGGRPLRHRIRPAAAPGRPASICAARCGGLHATDSLYAGSGYRGPVLGSSRTARLCLEVTAEVGGPPGVRIRRSGGIPRCHGRDSRRGDTPAPGTASTGVLVP